MFKSLTITLAQLNPSLGDLRHNYQKIVEVWEQAETDLVVFPELILCGYPPEDLVLKPFFLDEVERLTRDLVAKSKDFSSAALISAPWRIDGKTYIAVHLVSDGEIIGTVLKHNLPNYGVFDERRVFEPGPLPEVVVFKGVKLGIMICEDSWWPEPAEGLKAQGAEMLIVPNASPFTTDKYQRRLNTARARVIQTNLPMVYVTQVGGQDDLVFDGGSFVMDAQGEVITQGKFFAEDVFIAGDNTLEPLLDENERIYEAVKLGLRDYIGKNGFPGVVLGLSGGIDSALAAVIAVDALGADKVHAIMMPSEFTSQDSLDDAAELSETLGIQYEIVPIKDAVKTFEGLLGEVLEDDLAHQNMQSRIRGLILMAVSNAGGKMVLSTGNKSEMAVGYATLYGDMNGGFNVLKDLYKTQVYALARWGGIISERVITKAPTAELKADQKDQDSLPPYEDLDAILHDLIEEEMGVEDITAKGFDRETIVKVWRMMDRSQYKRNQAPPGPKITRRSFGRERRYPMTNHFSKMIE
ncbi:NAD+ synthase [Alphaproteobacteria bacterium]|nr:NAD+ synthase [Alphaproteobacteria bacterium]